MNSAFISIKDKEIQYYNKTLLSFLKRYYSTSENIPLVSNVDINELFDNIISENFKINAFEQVASILNKKYNEVGDKFVFIGTKDIEMTPTSCINLEVYGRCYSSFHNKIDKYEFIFNDITRSKQIEQKNAEFKYKTLFLSKIAHEFKNPLLCISELVEQVHDKLAVDKETKENTISEILKQIKALSGYLIILVKDMDFFSQKNSGTMKKKLELDKVNLSDIIKFCNNIVNALIKKSHKQANINFQVIKDRTLPNHITSDEIKLKQILINLLSNAVKYTCHGSIYLKVSLEEGQFLKIQVEDTGKGISETQKAKLFTPFSNEFDKLNKVSSGLGLSIVKELVELLGSKIEHTSTISKGSSFWFSLGLDESDLNSSRVSDTTIKGTHFNEQPIQVKLNTDGNVNTASTLSHETSEAKYNIIVVDDDVTIRHASIRLLQKVFKEKNLSVKILEASDGIECLYIYYNYVKDGRAISFILSDETMTYMNGSYASEILSHVSSHKNIIHVPYYILSAYENLSFGCAKETIDMFLRNLSGNTI
jgi:signal transduction histidine kinase